MFATINNDVFLKPIESSKYLKRVNGKFSPSMKKVTFADEKGFNLISVKNLDYFDYTELCRIIVSDKADDIKMKSDGDSSVTSSNSSLLWVLQFQDPSTDLYNVEQRLLKNKIALESVRISPQVQNHSHISGTVKVKSVPFDKIVSVRVSFDNWRSFTDHRAIFCFTTNYSYVIGSAEKIDLYWFQILLPSTQLSNDNLTAEFAIVFQCKGVEFWDNNSNRNYSVTLTYR